MTAGDQTLDHRQVDHRRGPRRRGEALRTAILAAALAELHEVGYAGLTMDRVAERARTGKASVYRLWPSRLELAVDAVRSTFPDLSVLPDRGNLRADLLAVLRRTGELLRGPTGDVLRGLLGDALARRVPIGELRERSRSTGYRVVDEVLRRAVARGEVAAAAVTPRRLEAGQALLQHHFLFGVGPVSDEVIVEVVDEVLLPLFLAPVAPPLAPVAPPPS